MKEDHKNLYEQLEFMFFEEAEKESMIFQDPTPLSDIKAVEFSKRPLPDNVQKGRSLLIGEVLAKQDMEEEETCLEDIEISDITKLPVSTRISLSFTTNENGVFSLSHTLNTFDREVIDAVASLSTTTQIMSSATIYRVITGKDESVRVNNEQKRKVEQSMERCSRCLVSIDISTPMKHPVKRKERETLRYRGYAIAFESIEHQFYRGYNTYYKLYDMPPFYKFAEKLGKVSKFPFQLLNTPVSKTDNIIAVQSYLLREIDQMQRDASKEQVIYWDKIYDIVAHEGKRDIKQENNRTRNSIKKILDFWVKEKFILSYLSTPRKGRIEIRLHFQ